MIADGDDPPRMWMAPANLDATQCKMARAALGIGVPELAARAVVSPDTVFRLEKGERLHQHDYRNPRGSRGDGRRVH
jgi:DNA-binding XRE family transcriptional regulator